MDQEFRVSLIHQEDFEDLDLTKVQAATMADSVKEFTIIMDFIEDLATILKVATTSIGWDQIINSGLIIDWVQAKYLASFIKLVISFIIVIIVIEAVAIANLVTIRGLAFTIMDQDSLSSVVKVD